MKRVTNLRDGINWLKVNLRVQKLLNLLIIMMTGLLSIGFVSCGDEPPTPPVPTLSAKGSISIDADGSTYGDITVAVENTDWSVEVTQGRDWLTVFKNGNKVAVSAKENTGTSDRTGTIVVMATEDSKLNQTFNIVQKGAIASITVNGSSSAEHTFPGLFDNGKSGIDYKQVFKIKSNVHWTLSGKEDWMNVSPTSGNGDVDLTIYPSNANNSDKNRTATITLSGSGVSVSINIAQTQGKPVCYVLPANEVALYDRIGWEYTATSNVDKFQWILLSEREFDRMTDNELIEELSKGEELKFVDDYISFVAYDSHDNRITQSSTYYLVTIAYDADGKAGELRKTKIKTPAFLDVDNDAWVNFDNVQCDMSQGFMFDAIKEGYCNTYHLIYGIQSESFNSVVYAFQINYFIKNKKKHWFAESWEMEIVTDYPNNHTFTYYTTLLPYIPICLAYGWGVFKDGSISSDLVGFQWDTSKEEARKLNVRNNDGFQNITYRRSVETERAKKVRKIFK